MAIPVSAGPLNGPPAWLQLSPHQRGRRVSLAGLGAYAEKKRKSRKENNETKQKLLFSVHCSVAAAPEMWEYADGSDPYEGPVYTQFSKLTFYTKPAEFHAADEPSLSRFQDPHGHELWGCCCDLAERWGETSASVEAPSRGRCQT